MGSIKQVQITFDCAEPERVARFWCEVLGYVVPPPPPGFESWGAFDRSLPAERQGAAFACVDPNGVGPRLFFQRVPEGKVVKNRVHLDLRPVELTREDEVARLIALGATQLADLRRPDGRGWITLADPEGNEFCVLGPLPADAQASSEPGTDQPLA